MVMGISVSYIDLTTRECFQSSLHLNQDECSEKPKVNTFNFDYDEFIIEIYGNSGDAIDAIGFVTNKGNSYFAGGGGGSKYSLKAPEGHHFGYFKGGFGGYPGECYLDYFECFTSPNQAYF